jgi:hypothetical protein
VRKRLKGVPLLLSSFTSFACSHSAYLFHILVPPSSFSLFVCRLPQPSPPIYPPPTPSQTHLLSEPVLPPSLVGSLVTPTLASHKSRPLWFRSMACLCSCRVVCFSISLQLSKFLTLSPPRSPQWWSDQLCTDVSDEQYKQLQLCCRHRCAFYLLPFFRLPTDLVLPFPSSTCRLVSSASSSVSPSVFTPPTPSSTSFLDAGGNAALTCRPSNLFFSSFYSL